MHQRVILTGTVLLSAGMLLLAEPEMRPVTLVLPQTSGRLYARQPAPKVCTMTVREESHPDWAQCPVEEQEFGREQ